MNHSANHTLPPHPLASLALRFPTPPVALRIDYQPFHKFSSQGCAYRFVSVPRSDVGQVDLQQGDNGTGFAILLKGTILQLPDEERLVRSITPPHPGHQTNGSGFHAAFAPLLPVAPSPLRASGSSRRLAHGKRVFPPPVLFSSFPLPPPIIAIDVYIRHRALCTSITASVSY